MAVGKFAVPASATGGGGGGTLTRTLRTYTSGDTWSKPTGLQFVDVLCIGAGGGAAAGSTAGTGVVARGGGGGGAPMVVYHRLEASALAATVTVTIGTGGTGGTGTATQNAAGASGGSGGNTSFGTHVVALGGYGGTSSAGGSSRQINEGTPAYGHTTFASSSGRNPNSTGGSGVTGHNQTLTPDSAIYAFCALGGPSGAGVTSSNIAGTGGPNNRYYTLAGGLTTSVLGGQTDGASGGAGSSNVVDRLLPQALRTAGATATVGTSGGSGAGSTISNGGNGGAAGNYGAPGAGGGGCRNGFTSGSGSAGTGGLCYVLEYTV